MLINEREYDRPDQNYWLTPGGGIDPGESPAQAAVREVREETGLDVLLGADAVVVHEDRRQWSYGGHRFDQTNVYFAVRVAAGAVARPAAPTELESATLIGYRWWGIEELRHSAELFYPPDVADVLSRSLTILASHP